MVALPDVPGIGPATTAEGISGNGEVIVGSAYNFGNHGFGDAFAWDAFHGSRSIAAILGSQGVNLTGWRLDGARSASYDGSVIVGLGTNPVGEREAWIARLDPGTFIPEPEAVALMGIGAVGLYVAFRCFPRRD
jgi:hypothetical protein